MEGERKTENNAYEAEERDGDCICRNLKKKQKSYILNENRWISLAAELE